MGLLTALHDKLFSWKHTFWDIFVDSLCWKNVLIGSRTVEYTYLVTSRGNLPIHLSYVAHAFLYLN